MRAAGALVFMRFRTGRLAALLTLTGCLIVPANAQQSRKAGIGVVGDGYPEPVLMYDDNEPAAESDDNLARAIAEAYASNPVLAARRYDLRATDDALGVALTATRPNAQLQVSGGYDITWPGRITAASRPLVDRLNSPNIERNDIVSGLVIDQPITTGGRATSDIAAARADISVGRAGLRGVEGDLLVELIAAYADVRRDTRTLFIRGKNVRVLKATLDEVSARREAGELTRTDIALAQTQLQTAQVQLNAAEGQLETSRAAFAAIVGRDPGRLAPEPDLPQMPASIDAAFDIAAGKNPEIAAAVAAERASRARVGSAQAEGNPTLSLRMTGGTNGPVVPLDRRDQDLSASARLTLTIPLFAGGRVRSRVGEAQNRNNADYLRIEAARRQVVRGIVSAWNQWVTAGRNLDAQMIQLKAARVYYEGSFEEYREGLRSTFDVLYAQNTLREAEIAVLASKRDRYVAQARLLRQLGQLEVANLLSGNTLYDPASYTGKVVRRNALPWDGAVRAIDRLVGPEPRPQAIKRLDSPAAPIGIAPVSPSPSDPALARTSPALPADSVSDGKRQ